MEEASKSGGNTDKKNFALTFMQVVCAISVVTLHTNGCFWQFSATERWWFTANIIESVFYFAVPVFFMITGITLLDYQDKYSTRVYFKKRFEKTVLPYVAWSLIGVLFLLVTKRVSPETVTAKWIVNGILSSDGIIGIYWFFQPLFCIYLSIPALAAISKEKKIEVFKYALIVCFLVNIFIPFVNAVFKFGFQWTYGIAVASGYLFWVIGGYYVKNTLLTNRQKDIIYILALIGLAMHIIGTYILSIKAGEIQRLYKGYNNLPCVLYSIGVYVGLNDLAKKIENVSFLRLVINIAGKYTFPLYLMHWFVLRLIDDGIGINTKSIIYRMFAPYAIFIAIIAVVWVLRKVPGIRKIVP